METQQSGQSSQPKQPLLSICIPTYNRAEYLEQCLEAIVHQEGFDERVEVVISDNASTDGTRELVQKYQEKYRNTYDNIKYFRNDENLKGNRNLACVLQRATGLLRKATNDTMIYKPGALQYLLKAVEENKDRRPTKTEKTIKSAKSAKLEESEKPGKTVKLSKPIKPQVYFLNTGKYTTPLQINTVEQYIGTLGYLLTWMGSIALWDEDCQDLSVITDNAGSSLGQVPYLIQNFEKRGQAIIYDKDIMGGLSPYKKNLTYGLYRVFYTNFLGFIKTYLDEGKISRECYENVKKNLLLKFFSAWVVNWEKHQDQFSFTPDENLRELVEAAYKNEPYFWQYKIKLNFNRFKASIRMFARKLLRQKTDG